MSVNYALPIRKTLVPHVGQVPDVAGLPFFRVTCCGSLISRDALHFTQYACAMAYTSDCFGLNSLRLP